ncbi:MAG: hypothetical protein M3Y86_09505 [Verrucomicrobiota bacterium]|nr:hypothetical protein [Verrucomicrobiota bacterium]
MRVRPSVVILLVIASSRVVSLAQLQSPESDAIRVTISQNADGSRTAYEFDPANHRATASTTDADGKPLGKIRYTLDEANRFATGEVLGPKGQFLYKTIYKYDGQGRLSDETQLTKDDAVKLRLVYAYDVNGKQAGYSVYDADGKLLGQTSKKR